jgi:hypothetical protein
VVNLSAKKSFVALNPRGDFSTTDNLVFKWRKFHIFINAAAAADTKFWSNIFLQIFEEKQAGPTVIKLFYGCNLQMFVIS